MRLAQLVAHRNTFYIHNIIRQFYQGNGPDSMGTVPLRDR